ncbi:MAG: hypothetical protein IT429_12120 [Gemmataceae bacterium]|nr:hypothetical protein [Gemmataceae bacterium]
MDRDHRVRCWNCKTPFPRAVLVTGRCRACGAGYYPSPFVVAFNLAFGGALVGWLVGLCIGLVHGPAAWAVNALEMAAFGFAAGGFAFGWLGVCLAVLYALMSAAAQRDPELLERGATIRRMRSEADATRPDDAGQVT